MFLEMFTYIQQEERKLRATNMSDFLNTFTRVNIQRWRFVIIL